MNKDQRYNSLIADYSTDPHSQSTASTRNSFILLVGWFEKKGLDCFRYYYSSFLLSIYPPGMKSYLLMRTADGKPPAEPYDGNFFLANMVSLFVDSRY